MLFDPPLQLLFLLLLNVGDVLGNEITISTLQGLIVFSNSVNSGTTYTGTTVHLNSDLEFTPDLSSSFEPIGINSTHPFQGTFDGNGHVISNLSLTSSLRYIGLFGYSKEVIIKNVVMDTSCSIESTYSSYTFTSYIGSIVGYCNSCTIENIVNMASVAFIRYRGSSIYLSGIVGNLASSSTIRNCVNYGSVTHTGKFFNAYIGGIVGICAESGVKFIQNCANYGTLTDNSTSDNIYVGGIAGSSSSTRIVNVENCVSAGKILNLTSTSDNNYFGSVVGYIDPDSDTINITRCMWTSNMNYSTICGKNMGTMNILNSSLTELDITTMNELNTYAEADSWDKWFMLHLNGGRINNDINQETLVVTQRYFPDPVKDGRTFLFWCTDTECNEKYNSGTDITRITDLYAMWNIYTVTFDFGNGTNTTRIVTYGKKYGDLPDAGEKEGHTFNGWFTEEVGNGEVTSDTTVSVINDHTLYAHWTINNYTLTFIFGNGTEPEQRILNYSDVVVYPSDPEREGYSFDEWLNYTISMPAHDLIVTALWTINNYTLIFNFNNGEVDETRILNYSDVIDYPTNVERKGYTFNGWSNEDITTMPAHNLIITAQWTPNNYTVTFNSTGGNALEYEKNVTYDGVYGELPNAGEKEGHTFNGWFTEEGENGIEITSETIVEIANNHILYAHWAINNYTLTFIFNNGESDEVRILNYNEIIVYPNEPVKEGYNFNGWDINITTMPAHNLNITAQWTKIETTNSTPGFVEIVLGKKDLSEEDIKEIIKEYTDVDFTIENIVTDDEAGGMKVIIIFNDINCAEEFIRNVNENKNDLLIKRVEIVSNYQSFSPVFCFSIINILLI